MTDTEHLPPSIDEIERCAERIAPYVVQTPVFHWSSDVVTNRMGPDTQLHLKLELFQRTGTFKARAAVNNALAIPAGDRARGITAISAGNHAIAAAYAARCIGAHAKVVMQASANPARIEAARTMGAEIVIAEDGAAGFAMVEEIVKNEGRTMIHPFEGKRVTEATATCAMELYRALPELDAVVVAIGAGGLCSGLSALFTQLKPECRIYAVEPEGAAVMKASLEAGSAQHIDKLDTIADSLAPPMTTPYCFSMCQRGIHELVLISDDEIAAACALLFQDMKFALEPAAATATAGVFGPLRKKLRGKRVAAMVCGSNIDNDSAHTLIQRGEAALASGVLAA